MSKEPCDKEKIELISCKSIRKDKITLLEIEVFFRKRYWLGEIRADFPMRKPYTKKAARVSE